MLTWTQEQRDAHSVLMRQWWADRTPEQRETQRQRARANQPIDTPERREERRQSGRAAHVAREREWMWSDVAEGEVCTRRTDEHHLPHGVVVIRRPEVTDGWRYTYTYGGLCQRCGTERWHPGLQRDRIVPGYVGGTYAFENVQYLCANCHEDKTFADTRRYGNRNS
jgi:5-methylcytosine-specific restriction endonuclease McrA